VGAERVWIFPQELRQTHRLVSNWAKPEYFTRRKREGEFLTATHPGGADISK